MNELRDRSKQMLETVRTGVEKVIEENEEIAINWIEQQVQKLNIYINQ